MCKFNSIEFFLKKFSVRLRYVYSLWNHRILTIHEVTTFKLGSFFAICSQAHTFPPLGSRTDNFCLQFSRAIASEWLEFIDRLYIASSTTEKTKGSLVKRSRSLLYESAASAESRLDKQGCQTDVSCRPFFGPAREPDRYSPLSLSLSLFASKPCRLPFILEA